ncbi:MAG TPA: hypothetical protein VFS58_10485 [Steroidobacteraceae bacterium]|nr:hypothetical protein [Steroidobacteraceae bacterium]
MKRSFPIVLLASLCAVSTALAATYVRVEKDGTKTYSDRPIPGGQLIDLQPAQSYSAPPSPLSASLNPPSETDVNFRYDSCSVSPENDATFANPESLSILASTNPPLRGGDVLTLTVDGQRANGGDGRSHFMAPVNRGTHTVNVTVTSPAGVVMCSSTSAFHVQRPSVNSPARQAPPPRPQPRTRPGG